MQHTISHIRSRIEDAALNLDLWTDVFRLLLSREGERQAEVMFFRQFSAEAKRKIVVRFRQGACISLEAELISLDVPLTRPPAIEFSLEDDLYSIQVTGEGPAADVLCQEIREVKAEIIRSVKISRALLSSKSCLCGKRSLLDRLKDPVFRLTLDGVIAWQNELAAGESWQQVYSCGVGKPLTLLHASEQAALRSALLELTEDPDISARLLPISAPEQAHSAIMALKATQACYTFTGPWVELFKPAPQVIAVLRRWDSKPNMSPSGLRKLYGLTPKEADLAIALAQGMSLKDYAERTGISFETARWHSKRAMQKMDCTKQQDVMYALLYRNALFSILD